MKQAIQEGFILDVLKHYTPVASYYRLVKKVEDDPEFDVKKAQQEAPALRRVPRPRHPPEGRDHGRPLPRAGDRQAARSAARRGRWSSPAASSAPSNTTTPSTPTSSERKSPYRAIVAFSGEHEFGGQKVTEATLNGFPSSQIAEHIPAGPVPLPDRAPTSSRPATTSRCCTRCTWTSCSRGSRPCRRSPASTGPTRRSTTRSCSTS